jgi:integrase/recombinase XerD
VPSAPPSLLILLESLRFESHSLRHSTRYDLDWNLVLALYQTQEMLTLYRRHGANCPRGARALKGCSCPVWVHGILRGECIRESPSLTNWEAANRVIQGWQIHGREESVSVREAAQKFLADCEARKLSGAIIEKYEYVTEELERLFGEQPVRSISVDDLRTMRNAWDYAPLTALKRLEYVRTFFTFCVSSGWMTVNPSKAVKAPRHVIAPTLPFSAEEWTKILWALATYQEIHPQTAAKNVKQLRALVLLMRFSGLRISDADGLKREKIDEAGRLFLYQAKKRECR